jgi:hypothetical protein
MPAITLAFTLIALLVAQSSAPSLLESIGQWKLEGLIVPANTSRDVVGRYNHPAQGGSLEGLTIWLFRDGTYIYTEWSDIHPQTIHDKGAWSVSEGVVALQTDPDVTWTPENPHHFVAMKLRKDSSRWLMQIDARTEPQQGESGVDLLRTEGWRRIAAIHNEAAARSQLLSECWRPEWFQSGERRVADPQ